MTKFLASLLTETTDFEVFLTPYQTAHGKQVNCKPSVLFASAAQPMAAA